MSSEASAFSCLPLAVRDSILQQAFQQLDQRHLFGVAPRVCRLWHRLALRIITSLDTQISTKVAAEQLSYWIQRHGAGLTSLNLLLEEPRFFAPAARSLLQSLQAAKELCSLSLRTTYLAPIEVTLHTFTNLTSLTFSLYPTPAGRDSILELTKLSCLSLNGMGGVIFEPFIKQLSTRLVGLTKLDLSGCSPFLNDSAELVHLHNLPQLKELLVGRCIPVTTLVGLGELPFTSVGIDVEPSTVTDANVWLQTAASRLQTLTLSSDTGQVMELPILQLGQLQELKAYDVRLNMVHVVALTQLTHLELTRCGLDDAAVCSLASLSNLRVLELASNPHITGAEGSMEVLARSMPHLTTLGLPYETPAERNAQEAFGDRVIRYDRRNCKWDLRPILGRTEVL